jgi:DNA repair photolyase
MAHEPKPIRGRGASNNPPNRFTPLYYVREQDWIDEDDPAPKTQVLRDTSRSILSRNDSPDVGFDVSVNPYRGCEHGCIYCYARPTHEYLGFSAGLEFESNILIKQDAAELLKQALRSPRWQPQPIALSGITDPYQPLERRLQLTRQCLDVLREFRNPVVIITKNHLVTRDLDLLAELAIHQAAMVYISITTLDAALCRQLEPRASIPERRLAAIEQAAAAGVSVGVLVAPVIPGLNDHEVPSILHAAHRAGARYAGSIPVRLPHAVGPLLEQWLSEHYPTKKSKVLNRIKAMRGGQLNDPRFGSRMRGEGIFAEQLHDLFRLSCRKVGISSRGPNLSTEAFRVPGSGQLSLFA